jgi:chaperonin GroES
MLKPLTDRVLIKPDAVPEQTESGLHLIQDWKPENMGEVVGVAERTESFCPECGGKVFTAPSVKVGDVVLFSWTSGQEIRVNGERFLLMREADLLAVLENESV